MKFYVIATREMYNVRPSFVDIYIW